MLVPGEDGEPDRLYHGSKKVSQSLLDTFVKGRETYIGQLEIMFAVSPYLSVPEVLVGRDVLHFIDNTSACAALIKGYSAACDSGRMVQAFHSFNVGLRANVYIEYVRSGANIADLPSRGKTKQMKRILSQMGFDMKYAHATKCVLPPVREYTLPGSDWVRRAMASARRRMRAKRKRETESQSNMAPGRRRRPS